MIATSRGAWFLRGCMAGVLIAGAANAASYFVRSERGGNLFGRVWAHRVALGVPWEFWESGNTYNGYYVDYPWLLADVGCGLLLAVMLGLVTLTQVPFLNRLVAEFEELETQPERNFQVSLRGLLTFMTLASILLALGTRIGSAKREALAAIYFFGPWILIGIAFIPRAIPWQQRALIVVLSAILMLTGAVYLGATMRPAQELDRVLLGIFVCWTPQTVAAAVIITLGTLVVHRFRRQT